MREKYKALFVCFICFTFVSCGAKKHTRSIDVIPMLDGKPINCQKLQMGDKQWRVENLAFFVSNIRVEKQGKVALLESDNTTSVSLVRINQQNCTAKVNLVSDTDITPGALFRFDLGVPFKINHLNPVTQPAPLNEPDMFWTWRNGYKFMRIDILSDNDNWAYHLGSVGCVSASAVRGPKEACAKPNLSQHKMTVPQGREFALLLHLDVLLKGITPTEANRCVMHGDKESACGALYANVSAAEGSLFTLENR